MPAITSAGIGSGLDVENIVSQLVSLEARPLQALRENESNLRVQLSAFGTLNSNLSAFNSAVSNLSDLDNFRVFSATSSDDTALTVTADSTAAVGTFDITVTQLAQRNKFTSDAFTDSSTVVGTGDLTIQVGATSFTVTIDASNDQLAQIRNAINLASDNAGVTASILNEDGGSRLILTANDTGSANALTITDNLSTTLGLVETDPELDAIVDIDGFTVTRSSNTIDGAIQGVTLNLLTQGGSATVNIARDDAAIAESINGFATAFNTLRGQLNSLRREGGSLEADNTVLTIQNGISRVLNDRANIAGVSFGFLAEIGLARNKAGDFILDQSLLTSALDNDFEGVSNLLADSSDGFLSRLDTLVSGFIAFDGLVQAREDGLDTQIRTTLDQQDELSRRLETIEQRIRNQFIALDGLVGQLQSTSSFLSQQLAALPGSTRNN